jgi:putative DNA primase/helicase
VSGPLERLAGLRRTSYGWQARCPAHDDRRPSLSVRVIDGRLVFHCFAGCREREILAALGLEAGELRAPVGARPLPRRIGAEELDAVYAYAVGCFERLHDHPAGGQALGYLRQRFGVERELALALGLGYDPGREEIERPACLAALRGDPWLVVPLGLGGRLVGLQARRLAAREPRWVGPAGAGWARVGTFALERPAPLVLCEGPSDALAVVGSGLPAAFVRGASLCGSPGQAARTLGPLLPSLRGRLVVVAGDGDGAGRRFAHACREALSAAGIRAAILDPGDGLDLAGLRSRVGGESLRQLVEGAALRGKVGARGEVAK